MSKNSPANTLFADLNPGWGRSLGAGHGHPLQYSCLENPVDIEAWWAMVHWVTHSRELACMRSEGLANRSKQGIVAKLRIFI